MPLMPAGPRPGKLRAALGSSVFLVAAPGMVAGIIPWWLTRGELGSPLSSWLPLRLLGALLLVAGAAVILRAVARFVTEGIGTPAPVAPTEELVVGGLYRYVRNPMYLAVTTAIVGQAVLLDRPLLLVYAAIVTTVNAAFVHWYEEPMLHRQFGAAYDAYRQRVPAWLPRHRRHRQMPGPGT